MRKAGRALRAAVGPRWLVLSQRRVEIVSPREAGPLPPLWGQCCVPKGRAVGAGAAGNSLLLGQGEGLPQRPAQPGVPGDSGREARPSF